MLLLREKGLSFMVGLRFFSFLLTGLLNPILASQNGSERFLRAICMSRTVQNGSLSCLVVLSIVTDSCRTVDAAVVLILVLPHNVVDVELLVPDMHLLRSCSFCVSFGFYVFCVAKITKNRPCNMLWLISMKM